MGDMCHCFWCGTKTPPCFTCLRDAPRKVMVGRISAGSGNQVCDVFLRGQTATSITMRGLDLMHPWTSSALRAPINPTGSAQPCLGHPTPARATPPLPWWDLGPMESHLWPHLLLLPTPWVDPGLSPLFPGAGCCAQHPARPVWMLQDLALVCEGFQLTLFWGSAPLLG